MVDKNGVIEMKSFIIALILIFIIGLPTYADDWTQNDIDRQIAFTIFACLDWNQTYQIATDGTIVNIPLLSFDGSNSSINVFLPKHTESNPFLGKHPSVDEVNNYFLLCISGNYFIAKKLPEKWRFWWQTLSILCETYCITGNIQLGISFKI